ncbi:MAG: Lrp/AsnC family transcriptional regulator, partial [Candidatus Diapherotrites archaeon]|nr:Lrp/AsnC family transcriptional regulator [Candidatus Diapherotrites archaeon]
TNENRIGFTHPVFIGIRTELPKTNQVVKELARNDSVSEIYQTIGDYNLRIAVLTPSLEQTRSFVENLSRIEGVLDVKSTLVLKSLKDDKYSSLFSLTKALPFEE